MQRILFATVFSLFFATAQPALARKWISNDGRHSTDAELVSFDDASVVLKKPSGDTVTVPLERLSDADRHYLSALKKKPASPKETLAPAEENKEKKETLAPAKENKKKKESLVSYAKDVQPFLAKYCGECHKAGAARSGYDVTSYEALMRRGQYGALVVPGKPDISRLCEVMQGMSKSMPPRGAIQPMAEEIAKITEWVEAGAKDDSQPPPAAGKARASGPKENSRQKP